MLGPMALLFPEAADLPEGFVYRDAIISPAEESAFDEQRGGFDVIHRALTSTEHAEQRHHLAGHCHDYDRLNTQGDHGQRPSMSRRHR